MQIRSDDFSQGEPIPASFAFGRSGPNGEPCVLSDNLNPHLAWTGVPDRTASFVLMCIDTDVPTVGDDVNQAGREVPAELPRAEFTHWLMVDIPVDCRELSAGSCSDGVVAHGKQSPFGPPGARQGLNDYTGWFAGDADMGGDYFGYDGPCPPWNDALLHHYHFRLYALSVATLDLPDRFALADVRAAIAGHVLAEATLTGTYTLNPRVRG